MIDDTVTEEGGALRAPARWWPRIRLLVSFGLLAAVISRLDLQRAAEVLSSARLELIALTILIGVGGRFFAALRWYILIRAMDTKARYSDLVRLTFVGMFLQFFPAGSIALEVGRVYGLSRATDDLAGSFASVLAERLFGLIALILLALIGLSVAPPGVPEALSDMAWVGFVIVATGSFALMTEGVRLGIGRTLSRLHLEPVRRRLRKLYDRLDVMRGRPRLMAWSMVAALANTAFRILPAYLIALALGVQVGLLQLFIIVPIIVFAAQVPISVGGLGVREAGWVALLGLVGVPASDAVVMSLLLVAIMFVVALPGAWFYGRHGLAAPEERTAPCAPAMPPGG